MRGFGGRRLFVDGAAGRRRVGRAGRRRTSRRPCSRATSTARTFELEAGKRVLIQAEAHSATHEPCLLAIGCAAPAAADRIDVGRGGRRVGRRGDRGRRQRRGLGDRGPRPQDGHPARSPGRAGRARGRGQPAGPSSSSTPAARWTCPGRTTWPPSSTPGCRARSSATRWPTCCSASPSRAAGCRSRSPAATPTIPAYRHDAGPERRARLREGVNVGYRGFDAAGIEPRFAFGHGLGYTTFEYESLIHRGRRPRRR